MAVGAVTKYNQTTTLLVADASPNWDAATAGTYMFGLVTSSYTPSAAHTTAADLGANIITAGDGAPINATGRTATEISGVAWLDSADANFGSTLTLTAKYLVCLQPVTPGTYASTAKLLWYVDLDTTGSVTVTAGPLLVVPPTNGWASLT